MAANGRERAALPRVRSAPAVARRRARCRRRCGSATDSGRRWPVPWAVPADAAASFPLLPPLDADDPRYAPVLVVRDGRGSGTRGGVGIELVRRSAERRPPPPRQRGATATTRVVVRFLAPCRVAPRAAALEAAFAGDGGAPPAPGWLRGELDREAARYAADPTPWTTGDVVLPVPPWPVEEEEERGGVVAAAPPTPSALPTPAKRSAPDADSDLARVRTEEAWGRWLWLAAEVEGGEAETAAAAVAGGAALLLHDRAASLIALRAMCGGGGGAAGMDYGLWLRDAPPLGWPPARAALLWWLGVAPQHQRRGVARALVSAAEGVAVRAGFPRLAVQADAAPRPGLLAALRPPPAPLPAHALYEAAGYGKPPLPRNSRVSGSIDRSAVLLTRWCGPAGACDDAWGEEG